MGTDSRGYQPNAMSDPSKLKPPKERAMSEKTRQEECRRANNYIHSIKSDAVFVSQETGVPTVRYFEGASIGHAYLAGLRDSRDTAQESVVMEREATLKSFA